MGRGKDMRKQKIRRQEESEEDNLPNRIYAKAYNNFAVLVEKSYSPRFVEVAKSKRLDIVEMEEEAIKHEKEPL